VIRWRTLAAALVVVLAGQALGAQGTVPLIAPPPPAIPPEIPGTRELDADHNRIDDLFDVALAAPAHGLGELVTVEAIFLRPVTEAQLQAFVREGGAVRHIFKAVSYGFIGRIALQKLQTLPARLGSELLLLAAEHPMRLALDEATRTGRVRPLWAAGFADSSQGFTGSASISIAIIDSGASSNHPDLAGRMVFGHDYASDSSSVADLVGHGSFVAGVAVGSGASAGSLSAPLKYTDSGDLTEITPNGFASSPMHLPAPCTLSATATWLPVDGGAASQATFGILSIADGVKSGYTYVPGTSTTNASPGITSYTWTAAPMGRFSATLTQNATSTVGPFTVASTVTPYPASTDGFPKLRGVAASSTFVAAKVADATGAISGSALSVAMDDLVTKRQIHSIKVANISLGSLSPNPTHRAKANTMVSNGITVVVAMGNDGPTKGSFDPARAAKAITVGATSDVNALTEYTSIGTSTLSGDGSDDFKPDLLAPGGSLYHSSLLSVDSNDGDAKGKLPDAQPDDYSNESGTSFAAPFVAGAAALVIQAMETVGMTWSFESSRQPLFVKMILLASATELNAARELDSNSPTLGRQVAPKDLYEGYGIVNPDAAIEAVRLPFTGAAFSASATGRVDGRRAWGRKLTVGAGSRVELTLQVPTTADFDLALYAAEPDANGNPVTLAASTTAGLDADESLTWTIASAATAYLFVKRVSGLGAFTVSATISVCGNGAAEALEQCDDGNQVTGDCCSAQCQFELAGSACSDGQSCTHGDACTSGVCAGLPTQNCGDAGAGSEDGGLGFDAGLTAPDAGGASSSDAGTSDAGPYDAGRIQPDGGDSPTGLIVGTLGCGCQPVAGVGAASEGLLALLVVQSMRRARRRGAA
jgi:cysteine-rich repeat protein